MKPLYRNISYGLIVIALIAGIVFIFIYSGKNRASRISTLKSKAKKEYLGGAYSEAALTNRELVDSFKVDEEALRLNYANAAFLTSWSDSSSSTTENKFEGIKADSSNLKNIGGQISWSTTAQQEYSTLTKAKKKYASMANNQLGIQSLKVDGKFIDEGNTPDKTDSLLRQSLILFQEALRKDPSNDSARYNYELLKMKLDFPLVVYSQAEQLVKQRKYSEAYHLMTNAIKRDARMKKYEEFTKKVFSVYKIDSLKRS